MVAGSSRPARSLVRDGRGLFEASPELVRDGRGLFEASSELGSRWS